jgi:N-acetylglucosamine-6-phosphate deacetylase
LPGALEAIERLTAQGVLVSAGHSNATSQQMRQAAQQGVRCVTHLMNAMRPFHHRDPGIVGHALTDDALYVEVIADGVHVHPEALRLIFNAKPSDRIVLVSDGLPLIGMAEDARFEFGDQWIHRGAIGAEAPGVDTGCCGMQANGTLVGSVTPLNEIIRLGVGWGLASFAQLVSMATVNPARLLGIEALGVLAEGALADVVVWDTEFNVQATWIDGLLVYDRQAIPTTTAAV